MPQEADSTLIILSSAPVEVQVASALQSAAQALGHAGGCSIVQLAEIADLKRFVFECDPWSVIVIDEASLDAVRSAFSFEADAFACDVPAQAFGYAFVAVPGFAECLGDEGAKRVAWQRMKAARHPGNPLG